MLRRHPLAASVGSVAIAATAILAILHQWRRDASPGRLSAVVASMTWSPPPSNGQASANPRFELVNEGGTPVRIVSIRSGYGCTTAKAEPRVVPPGGRAIIEAEANPIDVGLRPVPLFVDTDSRLTPEVALELVLIGSRRPPYLLRASGDLI